MPWQEVSTVSLKLEFVRLASVEGANISELCRRFGISRQAGYEVLNAFRQAGATGLAPKPRKPLNSPSKTPSSVEEVVLLARMAHPSWGGRKIRAWLLNHGYLQAPATSTITDILRRNGLINPEESTKHKAWQRFEHDAPNRLWQMDFKGHFPTGEGQCHPLTVLDDHSRFAMCLRACRDEQGPTVQSVLSETFRRYGLPERMTMDNGAPWGSIFGLTRFAVWLMRLGIQVSHSRPAHPQTQGKDERFHRTLHAEVIRGRAFPDMALVQQHFDVWRDIYNLDRPHEALGDKPPIERYRSSWRPFPETLPEIEYGPDDQVRKVQGKGEITFRGQTHVIGKALHGMPVALRPTQVDGVLAVYFCQQRLTEVDLRATKTAG